MVPGYARAKPCYARPQMGYLTRIEERDGVLCIEVHSKAGAALVLVALFNVALTADIPCVLRELTVLASRCADVGGTGEESCG